MEFVKELETILVVEDNKNLRESICNLLEDSFNVLSAEDGEQGIAKALEYVPDVVISDIMMPNVDGYQLLNTLKNNKKTSKVPVVLLTALGEEERELEGLNTGADDYIVKPFKATVLLARIRNLIRNRKSLMIDIEGEMQKEMEASKFETKDPTLALLESLVADRFRFKNIPIPKIADEMNMTPSRLERYVKKNTGMSPNQYIRDYKLQKAKFMLDNDQMNVSHVSYKLGFNSLSYFGKCFKAKYGYSPSEHQNAS